MAKSTSKNRGSTRKDETQQKGFKRWLLVVAVLVVAAIVAIALLARDKQTNSKSLASQPSPSPASTPEQPTPASELVTMDVAKAVMVTAELDFGPKIPTIAEALTQIERRYQPEDGQ